MQTTGAPLVTPTLDLLNSSIDWETVRQRYQVASPFPHFSIDDFLNATFAEQLHEEFPSFHDVRGIGHEFSTVNEKRKVQVTDRAHFPESIQLLSDLLASQAFRERIEFVTGIPDLLADDQLVGGGIHETGSRGRLDVHVDFNYITDRALHRRLNILIYFNKDWSRDWGGAIELWDTKVKSCEHSFEPVFNRCVVFETSEISYHGVSAVTCPPDQSRKSFAAYYYTVEAPAGWDGKSHSTVFRARPDERLRGIVLMPMESLSRRAKSAARSIYKSLRNGRS